MKKKSNDNYNDAEKEQKKQLPEQIKEQIVGAIDQNGNKEIDIEDIIILGMKVPGVKINRENFLRKELFSKYPKEIIDKAILDNPMKAGVDSKDIDRIADAVIQFERNCVSGISLALGMPGGVAMVATIPADIAQYYGYLLRAMQKLMYLYGFPQINLDSDENGILLDSETINTLTLCMGIMYGSAAANNAIKAISKGLAIGVEKKLLNAALTKGTIYPIVKQVAKWFGAKITKDIFAGFFRKAIPVVGGVVGGGITYLSFKPCCIKLKNSLSDTWLSNPNHLETKEEAEIIIDSTIDESVCSEMDPDMDFPSDKDINDNLDEE